MTNEQAREVFNAAARNAKDADAIANIELTREYFTNPAFRAWLEQNTWEQNNRA